MNKFTQHIPSFVDGCTAKSFEFETQEELVLKLRKLGYGGVGKWFELSDNLIMEVSDEGYHWWVAGSVRSTTGLTFDKWKYKDRPDTIPRGGYTSEDCIVTFNGIEIKGFAEGDIVTVNKQF